MKETKFIEQNQKKWREFEEELDNNYQNPEKLSKLFIETTDDLSFSRTYYPNRSVRVYLNNISQKTFQLIYKKKKSKDHDFFSFWTKQLPDTLWHNRKQLLWAFKIFMLGLLVAIVSSIYDSSFVVTMLGDEYLNMTKENIANNDPLGVYSNMEPLEMFLLIAVNNIRVCFLVFILGLFYGAGTVFFLFKESIRVGAFMFFFYQQGLFEDAFFTVMLHGSIELSMIVFSGMAGMVLAKGLVFPKTYSRFQSFVSSAREGVVIMIAVSVFLIFAAFIEGFATRHTEVSNIIRGLIIFLSFAIVIGYFILYPYLRFRSGKTSTDSYQEKLIEKTDKIDLTLIKETGQIFTDIFHYFKANLGKHVKVALFSAAGLTFILTWMIGLENFNQFLFDPSIDLLENAFIDMVSIIYPWDEINNFFNFGSYPLIILPLTIFTTLILGISLFSFQKEQLKNLKPWNFTKKNAVAILLSSLVILISFYPKGFNIISAILVLPFFVLVTSTAVIENLNWPKAINRTFTLLKGNFTRFTGVFLYSISIPWLVMIATSSVIWQEINRILRYNIEHDSFLAEYLPLFVYSTFSLFLLSLVFPLLVYGMSIFQSTAKEINSANELMKKIQNVGLKKQAYGLEKE